MDVLRELGEVVVQELGVAPGKHCSLALIEGVPVMGIPGPPGGALLISRYYLRAAVSLLSNGSIPEPLRLPAELTAPLPARQIDFMQPVRLSLSPSDGKLLAEKKLLAAPLPFMEKTRASAREDFAAILYCPKDKAFSAGENVMIELPDTEIQISETEV